MSNASAAVVLSLLLSASVLVTTWRFWPRMLGTVAAFTVMGAIATGCGFYLLPEGKGGDAAWVFSLLIILGAMYIYRNPTPSPHTEVEASAPLTGARMVAVPTRGEVVVRCHLNRAALRVVFARLPQMIAVLVFVWFGLQRADIFTISPEVAWAILIGAVVLWSMIPGYLIAEGATGEYRLSVSDGVLECRHRLLGVPAGSRSVRMADVVGLSAVKQSRYPERGYLRVETVSGTPLNLLASAGLSDDAIVGIIGELEN